MREFRKSWNDLIYILKETTNSQEILAEIKSLIDKWRTELGNEEYEKIESELNKEFEGAKSYVKTNQPIINKNDELKPAQENLEVNQPKAAEKEAADNKNEQPNKKGFKKIKILEEEIPEDNSTKKSAESQTKKQAEPEIDIDADLSDKINKNLL